MTYLRLPFRPASLCADPLIAILDDPASDLADREDYQKDWLGEVSLLTPICNSKEMQPCNLLACSLLHSTAWMRQAAACRAMDEEDAGQALGEVSSLLSVLS
jgi:hypothetical protein